MTPETHDLLVITGFEIGDLALEMAGADQSRIDHEVRLMTCGASIAVMKAKPDAASAPEETSAIILTAASHAIATLLIDQMPTVGGVQ